MYKLFIFFLLINKSNPFILSNKYFLKQFYFKTQEVVEPILSKNKLSENKENILKMEKIFIKNKLYNCGNDSCKITKYDVNDIDELMTKGTLTITSKSGSFCGFIFKFRIPKIDLIIGFSLRNRYNDILTTYKPLESSEVIIDIYKDLINNNSDVAGNYIMDTWLLNKQFNYTYFKEKFYNNDFDKSIFFKDCSKLVSCINQLYNELEC